MAFDAGFFGELVRKAASGMSAWRAGERVGEQEALEKKQEEEDRAAKQRREQQEETQRELDTQKSRIEIERMVNRPAADHTGHLHGEGGVELGQSTDPDAQTKVLDWKKKWSEAGRDPDAQPRQGPDPFQRRRSEMAYWEDVADKLVAAHGTDAYRTALDRNKNPEFREALKGGRVPKEIFQEALDRSRRANRSVNNDAAKATLQAQQAAWDKHAADFGYDAAEQDLGPRPR